MSRSNQPRTRRLAIAGAMAGCALVGVLCMGGCTQSFTSAAQALNDGVAADMEQLAGLTSESAKSIFASDYTSDLVAAGVDPVDVYGPMFSSLSYRVSDISIENNEASVTVTVANKDLTQVLQNYTAVVTNELATSASREALAALDDGQLTVHLAGILQTCLADPAVGTVERTVVLKYVKDGSSWKLQNGDVLVDALLGGLDAQLAGQPSDEQLIGAEEAAAQNIAGLAGQAAPAEGVEG